MLHLQIDPHSGVPVYRQLMDQVKLYIAAGMLRQGDRLPSIREAARTLTVNPTTIVKAYTELTHEGVVEMVHGKGAFIAAPAADARRMNAARRREHLQRLSRHLAVQARQIGASDEEILTAITEALNQLRPVSPSPISGGHAGAQRSREPGEPTQMGDAPRRTDDDHDDHASATDRAIDRPGDTENDAGDRPAAAEPDRPPADPAGETRTPTSRRMTP